MKKTLMAMTLTLGAAFAPALCMGAETEYTDIAVLSTTDLHEASGQCPDPDGPQ